MSSTQSESGLGIFGDGDGDGDGDGNGQIAAVRVTGSTEYPVAVTDYRTTPIPSEYRARLDERDLRLDLVDTSDAAAFERWLRADARGFHADDPTAEDIGAEIAGLADRRTTGVWDAKTADHSSPVATISSWPSELTVPGNGTVDAWAISSVTVSPTHRRRGIARAMLESELRIASELRIPIAILTVSEATLYGRYGFAPAVLRADLTIDTTRADWIGTSPAGRVSFAPREDLREAGIRLIERVRHDSPGTIQMWPLRWSRMLGYELSDTGVGRKQRVIRYDDESGELQGLALYTVTEHPTSFSRHRVEVPILVTATRDAYAALWSHLLAIDLVSEVRAPLRSVDEPLNFQVSDIRAVRTEVSDHLWTRILDVVPALESRRYGAPGRIRLEVSDPLGYAEGTVVLDVAEDGSATVTSVIGEGTEDLPAVALGVAELSALYLGGVSAATLARAGRIRELREGSASVLDAAFRSAVPPFLGFWF